MPSLAESAKEVLAKKNAMSKFLKVGDGESVKIDRVRSVTSAEKADQNGDTKPVLKLTVDVDTEFGLVAKVLEATSGKLIDQLVKSKVEVGSSFVLSRSGEGLETTYRVTDVVNAPVNPLA